MTARDWIEVVLAALLVLTLMVLSLSVSYALRRIASLSSRMDDAVAQMQRDVGTALQDTRAALHHVSELSEILTVLLRAEVTPTVEVARAALTHVEVTLKGIADTTSTVRRLAAGAEALTTPSAVSAAMERVAGSTAGRLALLAAGVLALLQGVLRGRRKQTTTTS